jgi:DNA-binding transcriptional MerR regulator
MTTWQIGELARATGLTVRTLHHYDRIGLLVPSGRGAGGHRRYSDADVRRLHQILALRGFGLGLAEIGQVLDGAEIDPTALVRRQLAQVTERIEAASRLRRELTALRGMLDDAVEPSTTTLIELIEVMTAMDKPLTPEQFAELTESRRRWAAQLTDEQRAEMQAKREQLAAQLSPEELADMQRRRAAMLPPS